METIVQKPSDATLEDIFRKLEISGIQPSGSTGQVWNQLRGGEQKNIFSPVNGLELGKVELIEREDYEHLIHTANEAFLIWRKVPAPKRGEIVRQIGHQLRKYKEELGYLVTMETGKILQEGLGEVQEMIDICDFAVGLSRQLYGSTMVSEREDHRMYDQYHPLGIVGIISAFNFPVAVWSWNAMLAAVCGNVCLWKPSEKTPLTAIACQQIIKQVLKDNQLPEGVFCLMVGDARCGEWMAKDARIPLISATGSTRMGKIVAQTVSARLGKLLLELGGNNAIIISQFANIEMAVRATLFGAVGTCGQRCTSTRRLIIHESVYEEVKNKLLHAYKNLPIGDPRGKNTLVGPLIDKEAQKNFIQALVKVQGEGGKLLIGGEILQGGVFDLGNYVQPALVEVSNHFETVQLETFAPILYLIRYKGSIEEAIQIQNGVKQGLSSALFSDNLQECEVFLSNRGSDCGIANINIGTSGAEIGGAFGGEKETGGGRESGSDAWKAYMRRQTNTINYSKELPLAQGIQFNIAL